MHILASISRSLINFDWNKISSVLKNCTRISISIPCMFDRLESKEKYTLQIHILTQTFKIQLIML